MNAVAPGLRADVDHRVSFACGLGVEDFILADEAEGEGVDQRISGVAGLELGFATEIGHAETVAVRGDAADYAIEDGVIFVEIRMCGAGTLARFLLALGTSGQECPLRTNWAEA